MRTKFRKIIVSSVVVAIVFANSIPATFAQVPPPPSAPIVPDTPTTPAGTEEIPPTPDVPDTPVAPTVDEVVNPTPTDTPPVADEDSVSENQTDGGASDSEQTQESSQQQEEVVENSDSDSDSTGTINEESTGRQSENGSSDPRIVTGDATSSSVVSNDANSNIALTGLGSGGATVVNDGNAAGSGNSGSATIVNEDNTTQTNSANVTNNLNQASISGRNSASDNVGDTSIETGDSNTSGTIINSINTNLEGISLAEFNIIGDYMGNYVLDFESGCISGCGGDIVVANTGNGNGSDNIASVDTINNDSSFQTNDAEIENNMTLVANSGNNKTNDNTRSNTSIDTGDANVSASVLNLVNTNIAGGIVYSVVNIFGDLVGDIIFPETDNCCGDDVYATNSENSGGSTNVTDVDITNSDDTFQFNNVELENNLILEANTGKNVLTDNTQGSGYIETGNVEIEGSVVNVANTNISGGDMWLVIVNEAGKWVGRILGTDGGNIAGSEGFVFDVDENGEITAVNSGNGENSDNNTSIDQTNVSTVVQDNNAKITNNLVLSANTGENRAKDNTGGNNSIITGDARIVANIVNFVNTNIAGSGTLYVNVVNVFGSWLGNFVTPGSENDLAQNYTDDSNGYDSGGEVGGYYSQDDGVSNSVSGGGEAITFGENAMLADSQQDLHVSRQRVSVAEIITGDKVVELVPEVKAASMERGTEKTVNINLAWLIVFIPIYLVFIGIRRREAILALVGR